MALVQTPKASLTLRFWKASLAWKNVGDWAKGWTQGDFIDELRVICTNNGALGLAGDVLLDNMIHDIERNPLPESGKLVYLVDFLTSMTQELGQQAQA